MRIEVNNVFVWHWTFAITRGTQRIGNFSFVQMQNNEPHINHMQYHITHIIIVVCS